MKIILNDTLIREDLYPFTEIRNTADIRIGILTIREKWERITGLSVSINEENFAGNSDISIDGNIVPTMSFVAALIEGKDITEMVGNEEMVRVIKYPYDIFKNNDWALRNDFELLTQNRKSQTISATNKLISPQNIFLEEGASVEHSILNASTGPIYIGKGATIMEGCMIRGPFALCEGATLKMGSKIYGATTIGPYCIAGGEIKNSIMFGYSNKAHDGYLGDSVIGEWCNLGAGTSNSNVRNTAGNVAVWYNAESKYINAGLKCGLLMGDYSRSAINTSFNTGTVAGICCNIFGEGFPPKQIPGFSWGNERYEFEKALQDIDNWKKLKGHAISTLEKEKLKTLYNQNT